MLEREGLLNVREMVEYRQDPEGSRVCVGGEDREEKGPQRGSEWRLCTVSLGSTSCLRGATGGQWEKSQTTGCGVDLYVRDTGDCGSQHDRFGVLDDQCSST